jgi:hypothetical protein
VLALFPSTGARDRSELQETKKAAAFHKGTVFAYGVVSFPLGEVPLCPRSFPSHLVSILPMERIIMSWGFDEIGRDGRLCTAGSFIKLNFCLRFDEVSEEQSILGEVFSSHLTRDNSDASNFALIARRLP